MSDSGTDGAASHTFSGPISPHPAHRVAFEASPPGRRRSLSVSPNPRRNARVSRRRVRRTLLEAPLSPHASAPLSPLSPHSPRTAVAGVTMSGELRGSVSMTAFERTDTDTDHSQAGTEGTAAYDHYEEIDPDDLTLDDRRAWLNELFGFRKWGAISKQAAKSDDNLDIRDEMMEPTHADLGEVHRKYALGRDESEHFVQFGNVIYFLLFGWWIALVHLVLAMLMYATIFGQPYGHFLLHSARYFLWPFGKYVERVPHSKMWPDFAAGTLCGVSNNSQFDRFGSANGTSGHGYNTYNASENPYGDVLDVSSSSPIPTERTPLKAAAFSASNSPAAREIRLDSRGRSLPTNSSSFMARAEILKRSESVSDEKSIGIPVDSEVPEMDAGDFTTHRSDQTPLISDADREAERESSHRRIMSESEAGKRPAAVVSDANTSTTNVDGTARTMRSPSPLRPGRSGESSSQPSQSGRDESGKRSTVIDMDGEGDEATRRDDGDVLNLGDANVIGWSLWCLVIIVLWAVHSVVTCICWLFVLPIPTAKMNNCFMSLLRTDVRRLRIHHTRTTPDVGADILMCTYTFANRSYWHYEALGLNVVLLNSLLVVLGTLLAQYLPGEGAKQWREHNSFLIFAMSLISVIPLSYYIGKCVASISAQTTFVVGAVLNASFGSLVELVIYYFLIQKNEMHDTLKKAVVGSMMINLLFMPGSAMIFGGQKHRELYYNPDATGVSALLLLVSAIGGFAPTIFYSVYGEYTTQCSIVDNAQLCRFFLSPRDDDKVYEDYARPLSYVVSVALPVMYIVGLIFTLKTHSFLYKKKLERVSSSGSSAASEDGHHSSIAEWSKTKCTIILLLSTITFAAVAETMTDSISPALESIGVPSSFAGLSIIAFIPGVSEYLNALKFARQGNIKLSLEIGCVAAVQITLIQLPVLVLMSYFVYDFDAERSFTLIFDKMDLFSVIFAIIILNYVTTNGRTNYFEGTALFLIYLVLVASYWFAIKASESAVENPSDQMWAYTTRTYIQPSVSPTPSSVEL